MAPTPAPPEANGSTPLPRRARLGVAPRFEPGRVGVEALAPGGVAERAGLLVGDALLAIGEVAVCDAPSLREALRRAAAEGSVTLRFVRGGAEHTAHARVEVQPEESIADSELSYEAFARDKLRLRLLLTRPLGPAAKTPAVLLLQGLSDATCEVLEGSVEAALIAGLSRAGSATLRVERRGVGDSEGALETTDLEAELGDLRAAIAWLRTDPRIDPRRIWLYGHSLGGMIAPLLLEDPALTGCVVLGTSPLGWRESVREAAALQHALRGLPEETSDELIARELARYVREPVVDARPRRFYRQLEAYDLREAWAAVTQPVLVLAGEHDWVTPPARGKEIAALVQRGGAEARFIELAGCDHVGTMHPNRESSLAAYGHGPPCAQLVSETVSFVSR